MAARKRAKILSLNPFKTCNVTTNNAIDGIITLRLIQNVRGVRSKSNKARSDEKYCTAITIGVVIYDLSAVICGLIDDKYYYK